MKRGSSQGRTERPSSSQAPKRGGFQWPWRADVLVSYGSSHLRRRLRRDALGRPFVYLLGSEAEMLRANGRTQGGREWIPLTTEAALVFRTPQAEGDKSREDHKVGEPPA